MQARSSDDTRLAARLWRSVVSGPFWPSNDRERKSIVFGHFILHFRPVTLSKPTLRYTHTFGLGGMGLVLFITLVVTGSLLMFVYAPSPERAHASILALERGVLFGGLVRGIHYWSANLLVVVMLLHLLRVFFTGGHLGTRQFNWVIGLLLLGGVLISNLTGYLLPWDQLSYWATVIVTGMLNYVPGVGAWLRQLTLGGTTVGGATLINFYTVHTTVMPVCLIALMLWHFWRVRKARGVVVPRRAGATAAPPADRVLALPNLFVRELAVAFCLLAVILALATFAGAPLGAAANPGMSPNPAKAPWYFVGFQELLLHFNPAFAVLVIPFLAVVGLVLLPYMRYDDDVVGVFMVSQRGRRLAALAAGTAVLLTPLWILADEHWANAEAGTSIVRGGVVPFVVVAILLAAAYFGARRRLAANRSEALQMCFVMVVTAFIVMTVVAAWFRGDGMALTWRP